MRLIHILAGAIGLLTGFVALYAPKGGAVHRRVGMAFVYAMLTMCAFGLVLAALGNIWMVINIPAGIMTAYLVTTSLITVRRPIAWSRRLDVALMVTAFAVGAALLPLGLMAIAGGGHWRTIPAFPFFLFGGVALLGSAGDYRVLRSAALTGSRRLARHLWRMCFALFIASMSFFIGQADVVPKPIRIYPLLAAPVLAVLATMLYWMWRVRIRQSLPRMGRH